MILIDSSVLIEYIKGNKTELLESIFKNNLQPCINHIIYSEFIYYYLSIMSGKSPVTLKKSNQIHKILAKTDPIDFISNFKILAMEDEILFRSYNYMKSFDLLPNDSLIIATCKYYNISYLCTFDSDFTEIRKKEKIVLLNDIADIKGIKK